MNTFGQSPAHRPQPTGVNPFARALAEARGAMGSDDAAQAQAPDTVTDPQQSQELFNPELREKELVEKQRLDRLRMELHRRVNPVDQKDIFDARKQQAKKEVEEIRHELVLLMQEMQGFAQDIDIQLMGEITDVGLTGKGAKGYFTKMKEFIMLLREKVHSVRTWATTFGGKKSKQAGLNFNAKGYGQTKTVWDSMHHERQLARAGG
jgi:hypothetical protein